MKWLLLSIKKEKKKNAKKNDKKYYFKKNDIGTVQYELYTNYILAVGHTKYTHISKHPTFHHPTRTFHRPPSTFRHPVRNLTIFLQFDIQNIHTHRNTPLFITQPGHFIVLHRLFITRSETIQNTSKSSKSIEKSESSISIPPTS